MDATVAIREGRAEVHPRAIEEGLYGPVGGIDPVTSKSVSETFADSLFRTYEARQKGKKKKRSPMYEIDKWYEKVE